jgi:amidophosphoribosyltransferase
LDQIREYLGADSIGYLDVPAMVRATGQPQNQFCLACFTGEYPVPVDPNLDKHIMERRSTRSNLLASSDSSPSLFPRKL